MGKVRQHGTSAELSVYRAARAIGLRVTRKNRDLPGSPDLANRKRKLAIFVHGCYWHRHHGCSRSTTPKSNEAFWRAKFDRNVERDAVALAELKVLGFRAVVIWECEANDILEISRRLTVAYRKRPTRI
jgi:DNA mismatch endonuclease (patch repair protein)